MAYRLLLLHQASFEIDEALEWYGAVSLELSEKLLTEFETVLSLIATNPLQFALLRDGSRKANLKKFPYKLIFKVSVDRIVIVAFAHHKRKQYWRNR